MKNIKILPFYLITIAISLGLFVVGYSPFVLADKVDDFIQSIHIATYDCPDDRFIPQVDDYLKYRNVLPLQLIDLKVHKAHWLICVGKNDQAQTLLESLLSDDSVDKNSQSYASIHYQLGFIFDVQ
jgi:hypothetical protein